MNDLPVTEDPFQLLGVQPSAGEKALRKAYARWIKKYPPDTAPEEFARLHNALERALQRDPPPKMMPPPLPLPDGDGIYERLVRLLDAGRYDALFRELDRPEVVDDATDPETAAALVRAAAVMTWHTPDAVPVLHRLSVRARRYGLEELVAVATTEAELAARFFRLGGTLISGDLLRALFGDVLLASRARRRSITAQIAPALADWRSLATVCFRIDSVDRSLARILTQRLQRESPLWGERAIAPLPEAIREALTSRIEAFRDPARLRRIAGITAGAAVGIAVFVGSLAVSGGNPTIAALAGGGVAHAVQQNIEQRYHRSVHPQLAALVAELGVQADTIPSWLRAKPTAGRDLRAYLAQIEWDVPLQLFASICALVREHERDVVDAPAVAAYR